MSISEGLNVLHHETRDCGKKEFLDIKNIIAIIK